MSFLYRDYHGSFDRSMKTVQEFENREALVKYLQDDIDQFNTGRDCNNITIEPYGFDPRIGWDCHIVHLKGYGVFGFTNGPVE